MKKELNRFIQKISGMEAEPDFSAFQLIVYFGTVISILAFIALLAVKLQ